MENSKWIQGKCIGKGSYGTVRLATRVSDGRVFALKSAHKECPSSVEALTNEIDILRSFKSSSPYVVEYYGEDESGSYKNLHVEYLPGGDLAREVSDVELIRSYTWCLVSALRDVHRNGVVHCDVKGSNLIVGPTSGIAKLADFGSAKRVGCDQGRKIVPRGSPLWMAPEVVRGESQGIESDVWALGCTVIEMFTGMPAWRDCGVHTLFKIGQSDELPEYPARVGELGRDFLDRCLVRDPRKRWSCDQLLQHPFLVPALGAGTKITEFTPRSVLDNWQDLDFDDDHDDTDDEFDDVSVRGRIGKLASMPGANWESDGWVEVRALSLGEEESKVVTEGTSSECFELEEGEEVILSGVVWEMETESIGEAYGRRRDGYVGISEDDDDVISCDDISNDKIMTVRRLEVFLLLLLHVLYCSTSMGLGNNKSHELFLDQKSNLGVWFIISCFCFLYPIVDAY